jgi:hypothetical protein
MGDTVTLSLESELALGEWALSCAEDPLKFVLDGYPWGEPGPLKDHEGPDVWQAQFLRELGEEVAANAFDGLTAVRPIRRAVSSGHGIGKSVLVAWLVDWIMSTRPNCQGTVTANTFTQLETKTWATIQRWTKLCITAPWFVIVSNRMYHRDYKESWFCAPQSCREENSEAFAGQHAADSTSFYINDEDSAVPDKIHEVEEGGLTDGEPMQFLFGNPTRSQGSFHAAAFGAFRNRFKTYVIDSRHSRFTNKEQIKEWQQDYGEDSDFFRVRVRGLPPNAAELQFIDLARVSAAQQRPALEFPDTPLVAGCDLAWGGSDDNVIRFRCGMDARSIPPIRIKGEFTRDPSVLTAKLATVLTTLYDGRRVSMLFLDSAGIAGPIAQRLREQGHRNIQEVNFGADSPDEKFRYMRDFMWGQMKQWLLTAAIDKDQQLETDLTAPGTRPNDRQLVWLESKENMKKRGVDSPDDGDALALTFAAPVPAQKRQSGNRLPMPTGRDAWSA